MEVVLDQKSLKHMHMHSIEVPDGFLKAYASFAVSKPSNEDVQLIVSSVRFKWLESS